MVRSYMRHGPTQAFGVICSPTANSSFNGRLAFVPAWEDVLVWDVKKGEMVSMWHSPSHTSPVSYLLPAPLPSTSTSSSTQTYAVSYADGSIKLWTWSPSNPSEAAIEIITFNGHKKGVSTMAWDNEGNRLASGGTEGEIVIWDKIAEVGLSRLKGHKGAVTGLVWVPFPSENHTGGGGHPGYLISTSRDSFMKLWDLSTQHCVQTIVVGRGEVTSCAIMEEKIENDDDLGDVDGDESGSQQVRGSWTVITGSGDGEARVWRIEKSDLAKGMAENEKGELPALIHPLSTLPLPNSQNAITQITIHQTLPIIYLLTSERTIAVVRLRTAEEIAAKRARRKRRDKEKEKSKSKGSKTAAQDEEEEDVLEGDAGIGSGEIKWEERVDLWTTIRANAKIKSFALPTDGASTNKGDVPLLLALGNNSLETYTIPSPLISKKSKSSSSSTSFEPIKTHSIELPGHKNDIRAISISSDDQVIATASNGTLKIWNTKTTACIRTMECGYALCCTFLPGDRHVVVGTKGGELGLYDIASSTMLGSYKAHSGPVWGVHVKPDGRGLVSGSADKDVKFWEFEMREEEGQGEKVVSRLGVETFHKKKQLALVHVRTLKMTDDVLAVKYSPDGRFLAVSLLDSTVKIFFQDTLKFFLSLYGHKLPVLSLDISSDSKMIVTCSADKNVKIWGMDFGDCHRSIFAHDDSIMGVGFEKDSHYFWTVGKDRFVKYWDGDKFELIQKLEGHHGEIWALAVSNQGNFVVSGSHDKSIRIWEKTDEPLFLEEEREKELEAMYDSTSQNFDRETGEDGEEVEAVQKQTSETLMAGEKIMEAIELADTERQTIKEWEEDKASNPDNDIPRPPRHPELVARGDLEPEEHVYSVIKKIPAANMEDALLVLPFRMVVSLLEYLDEWAKTNRDIILTSRILSFILRTNHSQIVANRIMRTKLLDLRNHIRQGLNKQREMMGYNLAALKFVKARWEGDKVAGMMMMMDGESGKGDMDEEKVRERIGLGRQKRKRIEVRA